MRKRDLSKKRPLEEEETGTGDTSTLQPSPQILRRKTPVAPIALAAQTNDLKRFDRLVAANPSVLAWTDADGNTLWHIAPAEILIRLFLHKWKSKNFPYLAMLQRYLPKDDPLFKQYDFMPEKLTSDPLPEFTQVNHNRLTPLELAISQGKIVEVRLFLVIVKDIQKLRGEGEKNLYHDAGRCNQVEVLECLYSTKQNFSRDHLNSPDEKGDLPIITTIKAGAAEAYFWFLDKRPTAIHWTHKNGQTLQQCEDAHPTFLKNKQRYIEKQKLLISKQPSRQLPTSFNLDLPASLDIDPADIVTSPFPASGNPVPADYNPSPAQGVDNFSPAQFKERKKEGSKSAFMSQDMSLEEGASKEEIAEAQKTASNETRFIAAYSAIQSALDEKNIKNTVAEKFPDPLHRMMRFMIEKGFRKAFKQQYQQDVVPLVQSTMWRFLCGIVTFGNTQRFDEFVKENTHIIGNWCKGGFNFLEMKDKKEGNTPAHWAAMNKQIPIMIRLLKLEWESQHVSELHALWKEASGFDTIFDPYAHLLITPPMQISDHYVPLYLRGNNKGLSPRHCVDSTEEMHHLLWDVECHFLGYEPSDAADTTDASSAEASSSVREYMQRLGAPPTDVSSSSNSSSSSPFKLSSSSIPLLSSLSSSPRASTKPAGSSSAAASSTSSPAIGKEVGGTASSSILSTSLPSQRSGH